MNDKRRLTIIIISVIFGTLLSFGLFMLRRNGDVKNEDYGTLITNFAFALGIVGFIGLVLKGKWSNK